MEDVQLMRRRGERRPLTESLRRENGPAAAIRRMLPDDWVYQGEFNPGIRSDGLTLFSPGSTNGYEQFSLIRANKCLKISDLILILNPKKIENNGMISSQVQSSFLEPGGGLEHVYYYEVFLIAGICSVGFITCNGIQSPNGFSQCGNTNGPGMIPESIGLDTDGNLWLSGVRLDGGNVGTNSNIRRSWTHPFQNGETIGCGIIVGEFPKYFFTRNGIIINPGTDLCCCTASIDTPLFPSVGVSSLMETVLRTNFGLDPQTPFLWNGDDRVRIISHVSDINSPDGSFSDEMFAPTPFARGHTVSGSRANPPSVIYAESPVRSQSAGQTNKERKASRRNSASGRLDLSLSQIEVEELGFVQNGLDQNNPCSAAMDSKCQGVLDVKDLEDLARELRGVASATDTHHAVLSSLTDLCRSKLKLLNDSVEHAMGAEDGEFDLGALLNLHEIVTDAIQAAEKKHSELGFNDSFSTASVDPATTEEFKPAATAVKSQEEDVCSLLCRLRRQKKRSIDAAWALLKLAKDGKESAARLEIISSGGLQSLLSIFKSDSQNQNLMLVSALTIAHLVPSLDASDGQSPNTYVDIIECLRYLIKLSRTDNGGDVSLAEILEACAFAISNLWINLLEPMMRSAESQRVSNRDMDTFSARPRRWGSMVSESEQDVGNGVLIEEFTSLSVMAADFDFGFGGQCEVHEMNVYYSFALTIESLCAVECAQAIAMKEGVIEILVQWLKSDNVELQGHGANALKNLTSTRDNYMAGWIHSQILNKEILIHVVELLESTNVRVRLAIAEVVSSLTNAPQTRGAIIQARGVEYLCQLLGSVGGSHSTDETIALAAGNALLRLASGPSVSSGDRRKNAVVNDIIQNGALYSLVSMTKADHYGDLRHLSVKLLRKMSESPCTLKLCDAGVVSAMGKILLSDVTFLRSLTENNLAEYASSDLINGSFSNEFHLQPRAVSLDGLLQEMRHALRGLCNILRFTALPEEREKLKVLIGEYTHLMASGGVKSLLWVSSVDQVSYARFNFTDVQSNCFRDIQIDACGTLSSLCPILIRCSNFSDSITKWAPYVLSALLSIMKNGAFASSKPRLLVCPDVYVDALQGVGSLAELEPLKTRIVDEFLPQLFKLQGDEEDMYIAEAATQVCLALGFQEVEAGVGWDAYLLGDKFSFRKSRLIQAMARDEIRTFLADSWAQSLKSAAQACHLDATIYSGSTAKLLSSLFQNLSDDEETGDLRHTVRNQFMSLFEHSSSSARITSLGRRKSFTRTMMRSHSYVNSDDDFDDFRERKSYSVSNVSVVDVNLHSLNDFLETEFKSTGPKGNSVNHFLQCHQYPINGPTEEQEWIMGHCRALEESKQNSQSPSLCLPQRVCDLLRVYFPSDLIRDEVIPIYGFYPNSSFDFRAIAMPSGRYFSFRREGQMVSNECDDIYQHNSERVHCTLGFRNSSFDGEFAESLLQVLYLCPVIRGLSFSNDLVTGGDSLDIDTSGSEQLATLARVLPASISHLTFDNVLSNETALLLADTFNFMSQSSETPLYKDRKSTDNSMGKGLLRAVAIINSPHIAPSTFASIVQSLDIAYQNSFSTPLQYLRVIDFSGNRLGDLVSASILSLALSGWSSGIIERIDLSRNNVKEGLAVQQVLQDYKGGVSRLEVLNLSSNNLGFGDVVLRLIESLPDALASLSSLDISGNGLTDNILEAFQDSFCRKCSLVDLNLSHNRFSKLSLNRFLSSLIGESKSGSSSGLSFVRLAGNVPALAANQEMMLQEILASNRFSLVTSHLKNVRDKHEEVANQFECNSKREHNEDLLKELDNIVQSTDGTQSSLPSISTLDTSIATGIMITVLFSAPLVWKDNQDTYYPIEMLDFELERSLLWQCFSEASRNIELSYDNATTDRLQAVITRGCGCLHFSGHGHPNFLTFEDGSGGIHWLGVDQLKALIAGGATDGKPPFNFVFVSACHSALAGEAFVESGVPHVVCCKQEARLMDSAALAFTRAFYLALAFGRTLKDSFEIGKQAVSCSPTVPYPQQEMKKFMLLPEDGDHDVSIINAEKVSEWPLALEGRRARNSFGFSKHPFGPNSLPTPPQGYLGREKDMYHVLNLILSRRFVNIVGPVGIGRSSLVAALCHYIGERKNTMKFDHIIFVRSVRKRGGSGKISPIMSLHNSLVSMGMAKAIAADADLDDAIEEICSSLKKLKALVVFDRTEAFEGTVDAQDVHYFLGQVFMDTKDVHVLITSKKSVGLSLNAGVGENVYNLGPLDLRNTVKLFAYLCPHLHSSRERKELLDLLVPEIDTSNGDSEEEVCHKIMSMLGDGVPARTFSVAYNMSAEEFQELKNLRINTECHAND